MTRALTPSDVEKHKISRKSHRKSRNGCDNCKRRRIKCNEEWPRCANCTKHSDTCSFSTRPRKSGPSSTVTTPNISDSLLDFGLSSQSTSPAVSSDTPRSLVITSEPSLPASADPRFQLAFSLLDLELFHNYQTATVLTLSAIPELQAFMRVDVPRLGFSHPFVLHCLLAVSALHLAYFKKDSQEFYKLQAEQHYDVALRTAVDLLPNINVDNCAALYMFTTFCSSYTMAAGPKPGDFLFFSDTGVSEWRILFKGVRAIIEANEWLIHGSELAPMFEIAIRQIKHVPSNNPHLQSLRERIIETMPDERSLKIYLDALTDLQKAFPMDVPEGARGKPNTAQLAFTWLYKLEDDFVERMQWKEPIALVIMGHFCVLLHDMGSVWWTKGWVDHMMSKIYNCLTGEHRMWMRWPIEETGWIPS